MHAVGMKDFQCLSMEGDLQKAQAGRAMSALSAIINFAKFREDRLFRYNEVTEELDELQQEREDLEKEKLHLEARLRQLQQARAAEAPIVEEVKQKCHALEAEVGQLNHEQAELHSIKAEVKEELDKISLSIEKSCRDRERSQNVEDHGAHGTCN